MKMIPIYALYGETEGNRLYDWLHWETIQSRSRLHDYRIAPHRHEQFFQVLHLTGGWGEVNLDGLRFDLRPGSVVLVPPLTVHDYRFSEQVEGRVLTLMERDIREQGLDLPEAVVLRAGTKPVGEAIDRLISEADRPGSGHEIAMRAHIALLMVVLRRAQLPVPTESRMDRSRVHAQAFRRLVDDRFRQTRSIADYAASLGISQTHLNRVCRKVLGTSALGAIESRIALEARRQLLFSSLSIKEIGGQLGYDDPAYFTRVMTRTLGMAPLAFRQRARQQQAS